MKKVLAIAVALLMFINTGISVYAEEKIEIGEIDIPITSSLQILNEDGRAEKYFSDDEKAKYKYTITPKDIPLKSLEEGKPIDIMLVCDVSGSMNDDMSPENWISDQFVKYDENNFDIWLSENTDKVGDSFSDWIINNTILQDTSTYEYWKNIYAPYVSFNKWKSRYAENLSFRQWMSKYVEYNDYRTWLSKYEKANYDVTDLADNVELINQYNTWVLNKKAYIWNDFYLWNNYKVTANWKDYNFMYNGERLSEKNYGQLQKKYRNLQIENKYEVNDYYYDNVDEIIDIISNSNLENEFISHINSKYIYDGYYLQETQMYSRWYNNFSYKYYYNDAYYTEQELRKIYRDKDSYTYEGKSYNEDEMKELFDESFSQYSWLRESDLIISPEEVLAHWKNNIENTYLYDGQYLTYEQLEQVFEEDRSNGYIYMGARYSLEELKYIYNSRYGNKYQYKIDNEIYSIRNFDYRMENNGRNYMKAFFSDSTLQSLWNIYEANSRINAAKSSMRDFVLELSDSPNASEIELGLVVFFNNAEIKLELSNLIENKDDILLEIGKLKYGGATNSGDGLRLAYHQFEVDKDSDKYIVFLADGDANHYTNKGGSKYYDKDNKGVRYVSSRGTGAVNYLNNMATYVGAAGINTYVIGVGDENYDSQKIQNQTLARYANYGENSGNIDGKYFSVMDSVSLQKLYSNIAKEIIQRIPINNIKVEIPFETSKAVSMEDTYDTIKLLNVKINGQDVDDFYIEENVLYGNLPSFEYILNEQTKLYTANSMNLEFEIEFPNGMIGKFGTTDMSKILFDVEGKTYEKSMMSLSCEIVDGLKPIGIDANFDIDEIKKTYKLNILPKGELNEMKMVYGKNDEKSIDICTYRTEKYPVKEYEISLSQEQYEDVVSTNPYTFDVYTKNEVRVEATGEIVSREGIEPITIMNFAGLSYETDNYLYDNHRNVVILIDGDDNLNNFAYKVDESAYNDFSPIYENNRYGKTFDLSLGEKIFTIRADNELGNTTEVRSLDFVHVRRPEIVAGILNDNSIGFRIYTFDDATMKKEDIEVKFYDLNGVESILTINSLELIDEVYKLNVAIDSSKYVEGTKITVRAKDNYRNVAVKGDGIEDTTDPNGGGEEEIEIIPEFPPTGFISFVKIGLYNTGRKEFISKNGEMVSVVMNMRYTYAADIIYGGQNSYTITTNKANEKLISGKIIDKETRTIVKILRKEDDSSSESNMIKIDELSTYLQSGKKYLVLLDVTFNPNANSYDKIYVRANMGTENETDELRIIANPIIE